MRILGFLKGRNTKAKYEFIKKYGFESYVIDFEVMRQMLSSPLLNDNGEFIPNITTNTWDLLQSILEVRLSLGNFTLISTDVKKMNIKRYEELILKHRYRAFIIDFPNEDEIKTAKKKISDKSELFAEFEQDDILNALTPPLDLNKYRKIHHFGDIHGCFNALMRYLYFSKLQWDKKSIDSTIRFALENLDHSLPELNAPYNTAREYSKFKLPNVNDVFSPNEFYIFLGDYYDRGRQNSLVVKFLLQASKLPNVLLIEGNHERWLRKWFKNEGLSDEFGGQTLKDIVRGGFNKENARKLYSRLKECVNYVYGNKKVLGTHGGLSAMPEHLAFVVARQITYGVGGYDDLTSIVKNWDKHTNENEFQVFGHRNETRMPINRKHARSFVLEGGVEDDGALRVAILEKDNDFKEKTAQLNGITWENYYDGFSGVYSLQKPQAETILFK